MTFARCPKMKVVKDVMFLNSESPVLVLDTIHDTGNETHRVVLVTRYLRKLSSVELRFAYLMRKQPRPIDKSVKGWCATVIPDVFVFGFGLDDREGCNRELPDVVCYGD